MSSFVKYILDLDRQSVEMETTTSKARENLVLSIWPSHNNLITVDPACLAASLWLRSQGYAYTAINVDQQISLFLGTYPTLHDIVNKKYYVGFESVYEYSRTLTPTADELALIATFKHLFIPAFMHSQWIDETNKIPLRSLHHSTIGLPLSLFYIRKKISSAQTWFDIINCKHSYNDEQSNTIYSNANRCFSLLEYELTKTNYRFLGGDKFSLVDAWVSSYLLVLLHCVPEKSRLRQLFMKYQRLVDYIQRMDEEQLSVYKDRESQKLVPSSSTENSTDIVSILHVISQVISFSIFFFMLTKIGSNSHMIT